MNLPEGYSKRLIGPNLFFKETGTVLDLPITEEQGKIVSLCEQEAMRVLPALGWKEVHTAHKIYNNGIRLAFVSPFDITLPSCDVIDFVWASVRQFLESGNYKTIDEAIEILLPLIEEDENLTLRAIYNEATKRGFNVFFDEGLVTIGSGKFSYQAQVDDVDVNKIPWDNIKDIPIVLVTGTNGKTTTVRMTSFICQHAKKVVGYCSTDWVMIDGKVIDRGDFSGPSGNRYVLTNPNVDVAVLEVARGGLCGRGLANTNVTAATISNISIDHLGLDGIETLEDLCEAKSIVYSAVENTGHAVINLDDALIVARFEAGLIKGTKVFFSQKLSESEMDAYLNEAAFVCFVKDGEFVLKTASETHVIATVKEVPLTVKGFAKHNIENALNAIALSYELGCMPNEISLGLLAYENNDEENLGRANVFHIGEATVIVDFAHNAAGLKAILDMSQAYSPERVKIMWGQTGDRMSLIDEMARVTADYDPAEVVVNEIEGYLREKAIVGQIPTMIEESLLKYDFPKSNIRHVDDELIGVDYALNNLESGDVYILCVHEHTATIVDKIKALV
jgi:cyanophycin synthetase